MPADILQPNAVADLAMDTRIGVDEVGEPRIEDWRHAVFERFAMQGFMALLAEELEVAPPEEVARVGECRHPPTVLQACVPPHVIEVQMRAHHEVDGFGPQPRLRKI